MAKLLIVHHTASPTLQAMFEAVVSGATDDAIEGVQVQARPALAATVVDVLEADGYVLGTPANLGYMSGALKHFFDQIYYPCLDATVRRPTPYTHTATATPPAPCGRWSRSRPGWAGAACTPPSPSSASRAGRTCGPAGSWAPPSPRD
jgi:hypothetical protein